MDALGPHHPRLAALQTVACVLAATAAAGPRCVNTRAVVLTLGAAPSNTSTVRTWVRRPPDATWTAADTTTVAAHSLRYDAPADGLFEFFVVVTNAAGASSPAPTESSTPQLSVLVDTAAPLVQVHRADWAQLKELRMLKIDLSVIEENLGDDGLRVFYRFAGESHWRDGGVASLEKGTIVWRPPLEPSRVSAVRIAATDLAGNRTFGDVPLPAVAPAGHDASERPRTATTLPVNLRLPDEFAAAHAVARAKPRKPKAVGKSAYLRNLGRQYLQQGRLELAIARFTGALGQSPDDPNLLVELANLHFRSNHPGQAKTYFARAAELAPQDTRALEGLALVALGEQRFDEARTHLQRLLEADPHATKYELFLGDVEHRLGRREDAIRAWRSVADKADDLDLRRRARERLRMFDHRTP